MEFQNERIKNAFRGSGALYTYVYIACASLVALSATQAVAKSTWQNPDAMIQPLRVMYLDEEEQRHLLYHFSAFSSDVTRIDVNGVQEYKYSTDCRKTLPTEGFGGKDNRKENRQGCLSGGIKQISKLFQKF